MRDWEEFVEQVPWYLDVDATVELGAEGGWRRATAGLPVLDALLGQATVTPVSVDGRPHELLAWGPPGRRRGWLTLPPEQAPPTDVPATLRRFWGVCGGIVERWAEPGCWWLNQDEVLTSALSRTSLDQVLHDYAWIWDDVGLEQPIVPGDHVVVAVEANGNLTAVHRTTGDLLLFAPDHSFDGVTPLPGCPAYSLMTIDDVPDLDAWIESCARAWRVD